LADSTFLFGVVDLTAAFLAVAAFVALVAVVFYALVEVDLGLEVLAFFAAGSFLSVLVGVLLAFGRLVPASLPSSALALAGFLVYFASFFLVVLVSFASAGFFLASFASKAFLVIK